ncbi:MAG TPA: hypothetical protein VHG52_06420 [Thermomicrobiales bacterium]|nr:hypothetical protein [Thermomicrobiales bacterium]
MGVPAMGEAGTRQVIERCVAFGGASQGRHVVAEWAGETTPAAVIAAWASFTRLRSRPVEETCEDILDASAAGPESSLGTWSG